MSIELLTSVSKGWLHHEGGFSFDEHYYLEPLYRWEQDRQIDAFLQKRFPDHAFYNMESNLVQRRYWATDQVLVGGIQPNLILGATVGATLAFYPDRDADLADINPVAQVEVVSELPTPEEIRAHPLIRRFDDQIAEVRARRPALTVIPPFFWDCSGRATIHGFITSSLKFYGQVILLKLFEDPAFVEALHGWLADVYIALIRHFAERGKHPVRAIHVGECSGTMLRDAHYARFVVPFINRLAEALGPVRLHSCGNSDHLLPTMKAVRQLAALDTGSNTSVAAVRAHFGSDFRIDLAPPLDILLEGSTPDVVRAWLDQVLAENAGGPLLLGYHLEPGYAVENCLALHDELEGRGLIRKGRP